MQNLVLCGFMGSGKSTVGPLVAAASGREFLDMDRFSEQKAGKSIPAIFAEEGEAGFREREHEACWELAARTGLVIASGGGAPTFARNVDAMKSDCLVLLEVSLENVLRRTGQEGDRPMIAGEDGRAKTIRLYEVRRPLYLAAADIIVNADLPPQKVAEEILRKWREYRKRKNENGPMETKADV